MKITTQSINNFKESHLLRIHWVHHCSLIGALVNQLRVNNQMFAIEFENSRLIVRNKLALVHKKNRQ